MHFCISFTSTLAQQQNIQYQEVACYSKWTSANINILLLMGLILHSRQEMAITLLIQTHQIILPDSRGTLYNLIMYDFFEHDAFRSCRNNHVSPVMKHWRTGRRHPLSGMNVQPQLYVSALTWSCWQRQTSQKSSGGSSSHVLPPTTSGFVPGAELSPSKGRRCFPLEAS